MKHNFNRLLFSLLFTVSALLSIVYVSCNKNKDGGISDKCSSISCAYGGYCSEGKCVCPTGYLGDHCEIIAREKFLGAWSVTEKGTITIDREYTLAIEKDDAAAPVNSVRIKMMYNYFSTSVKASVIGDSIFIPNQQLLGKIVFGKGFIYTDTLHKPYSSISMRYEVVDSANNNIVDDFGYYPAVYHGVPSNWKKQN